MLHSTRLGSWMHDFKLRHLKLGKAKQHKKTGWNDFEIVGISWNVHWMTDLYLAVIIRDYLRFFIKNTPAISNIVIEDFERCHNGLCDGDCDVCSAKWKDMVNNVADEFDELVKMLREDDPIDGWSVHLEKQRALQKKAFADLAEIFDELNW